MRAYILVLCLIYNGKGFSFSVLSVMLFVRFLWMPFIRGGKFHSFPSFLRILFSEWMLNAVKGFFCINWDDYKLFPVWSISMVNDIDLWKLSQPKSPVSVLLDYCTLSFFCIVRFSLLEVCWGSLGLCSWGILVCNLIFLYCLCLILASR